MEINANPIDRPVIRSNRLSFIPNLIGSRKNHNTSYRVLMGAIYLIDCLTTQED